MSLKNDLFNGNSYEVVNISGTLSVSPKTGRERTIQVFSGTENI